VSFLIIISFIFSFSSYYRIRVFFYVCTCFLVLSLPYCQSFHPKRHSFIYIVKYPPHSRLLHKVYHQYTICYANLVLHGDHLSLVLHPPSQSRFRLASSVHRHRTYRQFNAFPCRADFLVFLTCCEVAVYVGRKKTAGIRIFHEAIVSGTILLYEQRPVLVTRPMIVNEPDS